MERPSWDEYFVNISRETARRSNCIKKQVGSVLVKDNRIIGVGYNGTPAGIKNCYDGGCQRCIVQYKAKQENREYEKTTRHCMCLHAELNAILNANKESLVGSTIYSTLEPCLECAKVITQSGISRVIYEKPNNGISRDLINGMYKETNTLSENYTAAVVRRVGEQE
jgi:dCMP deaminase